MKVTFINESDAPAAEVKVTANANREFAAGLLAQIKLGDKAARVGLEEGDSVRGIKRALTEVSNGLGRAVNVRQVTEQDDDGNNVEVIYVKEVEPKTKA